MHLDEQTIELYVIGAAAVQTRKKEIARHLRQCKGCAALHGEIEEYYAQVNALQREQARRAAQALYAPETALRQRSMEETAPISPLPRTFPQRFVESLKSYPVRWSAGFAVVAAALALFVPRFSAVSQSPAFARAEKEFLVVYNYQREELWRKYIGMMIDDNGLPDYLAKDSARGFPVVDVNQDGKMEIFGVFGWATWTEQDNPWSNTLVCFNADGSELWRYTLHRNITLAGTPFSDDYRFYAVQVGDFDADGRFEVLGWASHVPWFPNVVVRLDAVNGTLLSEYWHNGMVGYTTQRDIDGDGVNEIFLAGQNNRFQRASMAVLDPREFTGSAPAPMEHTPDGIPPGREKFYLLFPGSDLQPFWSDITNDVLGTLSWKSDSTLEVIVREKITFVLHDTVAKSPIEEGTLFYYFDLSMRCVQVRSSDAFSGIRAKYRRLGLVQGEIDSAYLEKLRQGVRYWDGEKFVNEPVMNKRYSTEIIEK